MNFYIMTLFPEMVMDGLHTSIIGRAVNNGLLSIEAVNIRDYAFNKHNSVDDYPYGGGAGMLMQAEPVYQCYRALEERIGKKPRVVYLSPQGKTFHQEILNLEQRLKDLDKARNDLISLITGGGCDENKLDCEFEKIHAEEQEINENLSELRKNAEISTDTQNKIDSAMEMLAHENFQVEVFDNVIVRKLIDCVKVLSKEKLLIVFKGGVEVKAQMEK